jgi:predicted transcriptional regulator
MKREYNTTKKTALKRAKVLTVLKKCAVDGEVNETLELLELMCGLSRTTLSKYLTILKKEGVIKIERVVRTSPNRITFCKEKS